MDSRWVQRVTLFLFFATGACGLVYQVVWVRQLSLSFGISTYAISAVLAAFMSGLCLGASLLGRRADRFRNPLRVYGLFEIAIATYALVLYFVLSAGLPHAYRVGHDWFSGDPIVWHVARYGLAFVLLVIPTTLMGGTLPVLGRFFVDRAEHTGLRVGLLYGFNTLGAVVGTLYAGFWALEHLGIFRTTISAGLFNLVIGLTALLLSGRVSPVDAVLRPDPDPAPTPSAASQELRLVHWMLFLAGYAAMAYEVLWNRTLLPYIGNSVYAFSSIVVMFLLGWKLKTTRSPSDPIFRPCHRAPAACAASSTTRTPRRLARSYRASRFTGSPAKCTGMMARVRGVMADSARSRSMLRVTGSTSTRTGRAPTRRTTFALAAKVMAGTITSSPGPMPQTCNATSRAPVAEVKVRTSLPPR